MSNFVNELDFLTPVRNVFSLRGKDINFNLLNSKSLAKMINADTDLEDFLRQKKRTYDDATEKKIMRYIITFAMCGNDLTHTSKEFKSVFSKTENMTDFEIEAFANYIMSQSYPDAYAQQEGFQEAALEGQKRVAQKKTVKTTARTATRKTKTQS